MNLPSSGKHINNNFHKKSGEFRQIARMMSILMRRNFEALRRWDRENVEKDESGE